MNLQARFVFHDSVLPSEILALLRRTEHRVILDGTLGDGGHTLLFHEAFPQAILVGNDRDPAMLERARNRMAAQGVIVQEGVDPVREGVVHLIRGSASGLASVLAPPVEGGHQALLADFILLDLGVSLHHLRGAARGFSYEDELLDMRLDPDLPETAADFVNHHDEEELFQILRDYGEERFAGRIAKNIVKARPIASASQLARIVLHSVPGGGGGRPGKPGIHPATRTFQALRIAVNHELEEVELCMKALPGLLAPGGILAVISFHSLEDRIVKHAFRTLGKPAARRSKYESFSTQKAAPVAAQEFEILTPKPIAPTDQEIEENKRSRSAKLRALRRIMPTI